MLFRSRATSEDFVCKGGSTSIDDRFPNLNPEIDPKLAWALRHPEHFPVDVNTADYSMILQVPGIGVKSAKLIVAARRYGRLTSAQLKKIGIVMKKA